MYKVKFSFFLAWAVMIAFLVSSCLEKVGKDAAKEIGAAGKDAAKELGAAVKKASEQIDNAIVKVQNTTKEAAASAGDAVGKVDAIAADYQNILQELKTDLPKEVRTTLDNEIQNMIDNTVGITGAEFRCNIDFLGNRLIQKLNDLKRKLLGQAITPVEPSLCQVVPSSIDLALEPNRRNQIEIYGYDLNNLSNLKVLLEKTDNTISDVTSHYNKTSNYKGVINISASGINLNESAQRILLKIGEKIISEIPILKPSPKLCSTHLEVAQPNTISIVPEKYSYNQELVDHFTKLGSKMPNLCEAPWTENPKVKMRVEIVQNVNNIECLSTMTIEGIKVPSFSIGVFSLPLQVPVTASVTRRSVLYSAPPKYSIVRISTPMTDFVEYQDANVALDRFNGTNGLVREFLITGRANGCDVGAQTKADIHFNTVKIELKENSDCIDEYTFKQLVMSNQISLPTFKNAIASNPKLRAVSQTIPIERIKLIEKK